MPAADASPPPLKNLFDRAQYERIATSLSLASPQFDRDRFLHLTLSGLESRELMDRLRQTAIAADAALPGTYAEKLSVLKCIAEETEHNFVGIWFSEFAGRFGQDSPARALAAMRHFTRFGSAEFAVRPYLLGAPEETLRTIRSWTRDRNEHVRRLACEGTRPRLPWGLRLGFLIQDPRPTRPILEALKDDTSLYVRKSVANHLNDIAKDHPEYVVDLVRTWDRSDPAIGWVVRQGLRTLIKKGHPGALNMVGADAKPLLTDITFRASPQVIHQGDELTLQLSARSTDHASQNLLVDYVIHYVKASGKTSPKVFKWKRLELATGESFTLQKRQRIRDFSTRRHHAGHHRIVLQINGQALAETQFLLR